MIIIIGREVNFALQAMLAGTPDGVKTKAIAFFYESEHARALPFAIPAGNNSLHLIPRDGVAK